MPWIETSMEEQGKVFPLQHHKRPTPTEEKWPLDTRACSMAIRVKDRHVASEEAVANSQVNGEMGDWVEEPGTGGDILGGFLWEQDPDSKYRKIPAWSFLFPVVKEPPKSTSSNKKSSILAAVDGAESAGNLASQGGKGNGPGDAFRPIVWDEKDVNAGNALSPSKHFVQHTPPRPKREKREIWPRFPHDWRGVVVAATNDNEQVESFQPTDPRIPAVNKAGDPGMGAWVVDLKKNNYVDADRQARLQAFLRVIKDPAALNLAKVASLAWNLAGGALDGHGRGMVFDRPSPKASSKTSSLGVLKAVMEAEGAANAASGANSEFFGSKSASSNVGAGGDGIGDSGAWYKSQADKGGVIGLASVHEGGFIDVGEHADQHRLGEDADKHPMNGAGISTKAIFRGAGGDAPIDFSEEPFETPTSVFDGLVGSLRCDQKATHRYVNGKDLKGLWKISVQSPFWIGRIVSSVGSSGPFTYNIKRVSKKTTFGTTVGQGQGTTGFATANARVQSVEGYNFYEAASTGYFNPLPANTLVVVFEFTVGKKTEYWFVPGYPGWKVTDGSTTVSNVTKLQFAGSGCTVAAAQTAAGHATITVTVTPGSGFETLLDETTILDPTTKLNFKNSDGFKLSVADGGSGRADVSITGGPQVAHSGGTYYKTKKLTFYSEDFTVTNSGGDGGEDTVKTEGFSGTVTAATLAAMSTGMVFVRGLLNSAS